MRRYSLTLLLMTVLVLTFTISAHAQMQPVPDYYNSIAYFPEYQGPQSMVLMVLPDGSGPSFNEARLYPDGSALDATIRIMTFDGLGQPMEGFPWEYTWLVPQGDGATLKVCSSVGGVIHPLPLDSDASGAFNFVDPPHAGGWSDGLTQATFWGDPILSIPGLSIMFVSPDINGDLEIDLQDWGFFAADFFGAYHMRSDFNADGVINLSDTGFMATSIGISCN